jgi:hypothetical protein
MLWDGISTIPDETWLGRHCLVCGNRVYHDKVRMTVLVLRITTENTKNILTNRQKKPGETIKETSERERQERVNKWANCMSDLLLLLLLLLLLFVLQFSVYVGPSTAYVCCTNLNNT